MTSSFVYAGFFSDNIETNTVPSPTVPSDGKLLADDELNTDFNEEYYNDNHLVEDETEAGEFFDEKADFHTTVDAPSTSNSSKSTNKQILQQDIYSADSTKTYIMRDDSQPQTQQSDEYEIMPISSDPESGSFIFPDGWSMQYYDGTNQDDRPSSGPNVLVSAEDIYQFILSQVKSDLSNLDKFADGEIPKFTENDLSFDNFILFRCNYGSECNYLFLFSPKNDVKIGCREYFRDDTKIRTFMNFSSYYDDIHGTFTDDFYVAGFLSFHWYLAPGENHTDCTKYLFNIDTSDVCNTSIHYRSFFGNSDHYADDIVLLTSGKNVSFVDMDTFEETNIESVDPETGFASGDIKGEFGFKEDSKILTYKAWSDKELDKTYDVHLWAMDSPSVPAKINGSEDFPIRDLDNYTSHGLQLSSDKSSVQASYELESVYYYLHQMEGYDDSLESVDGYDFDEFESRENLNFAIAYRENGSSGDWIVCKSYQYNYGDLIENVMGSFTVKKDYVDFPDMDDYLEDYESWEDVALDETGGEGGFYNNVVVLFKWVGRNLMHFGHNFVGFFKWLIDCIPVLWENLTIALYNLVCDLKELALYFVNPKTKSIYAMTCERIPSFSLLVDSFKNNNSSTLPSFTFFGTKFSLNFSDYDIDFSFIRNISTILFYLLFGYFVFKLILKIFGFGSGGGDED